MNPVEGSSSPSLSREEIFRPLFWLSRYDPISYNHGASSFQLHGKRHRRGGTRAPGGRNDHQSGAIKIAYLDRQSLSNNGLETLSCRINLDGRIRAIILGTLEIEVRTTGFNVSQRLRLFKVLWGRRRGRHVVR